MDIALITEFVDTNELGLGLGQKADLLSPDERLLDLKDPAVGVPNFDDSVADPPRVPASRLHGLPSWLCKTTDRGRIARRTAQMDGSGVGGSMQPVGVGNSSHYCRCEPLRCDRR